MVRWFIQEAEGSRTSLFGIFEVRCQLAQRTQWKNALLLVLVDVKLEPCFKLAIPDTSSRLIL